MGRRVSRAERFDLIQVLVVVMNRMLWSSHKLKHFETYYHLRMFCEQMVKAYFF